MWFITNARPPTRNYLMFCVS